MDDPGFRFSRVRPEKLGSSPRDWSGYVELKVPALPDLGELISLGDRYLVSIGAHATHGVLLMARTPAEPLTVEDCLMSCALLTFALDAPVVPIASHGRLDATNSRAFSQSLKGTGFASVTDYGEKLAELANLTDVFLHPGVRPPQLVQRKILNRRGRAGTWFYYPWPASKPVRRAMSAYWLGTLSIVAPSRILNFWRAIEAVADKATRQSLFAGLDQRKVAPVWTTLHRIPVLKFRQRTINATQPQRRLALARRDELVVQYGSQDAALNHIVDQGRGKAAHADQISLEYDLASELGTQLRDAELLRYMARVAIEDRWRSSA